MYVVGIEVITLVVLSAKVSVILATPVGVVTLQTSASLEVAAEPVSI